ncbi:hypothetical protein DFH08DRAFT_819871 [Mycena albidolilacea]|uniref:Uncharacterized protein n=1 Tax=Mycena albidolilacea TaxID=1033008 RepID=A0AAD7EEU7_9AGAR|nr:hypothetical protein DFH08DRAFT_819871 [Mycena albidolilacea]
MDGSGNQVGRNPMRPMDASNASSGDEEVVNEEPVHGLHDCPEFSAPAVVMGEKKKRQRKDGGANLSRRTPYWGPMQIAPVVGGDKLSAVSAASIALVALEAKCKALEDALNLRPQQHEAESAEKDSNIAELMEVRHCASVFLAERTTELTTMHLEQQKRTTELSKKEEKLDNHRKPVILPTRFLPNATGVNSAMNVQRQERGAELADREYTIGKSRRDLESFRTLLLSFVQRITEASRLKDHKAGVEWASIPPLVTSTATPPLSGSPAKGKQQPSSSVKRRSDMDLDSDDTYTGGKSRRTWIPVHDLRRTCLGDTWNPGRMQKKAPAKDFMTVYETRFRNFSRPFTFRPLLQASTSNALEDSFDEVEAICKKPQISATTARLSATASGSAKQRVTRREPQPGETR